MKKHIMTCFFVQVFHPKKILLFSLLSGILIVNAQDKTSTSIKKADKDFIERFIQAKGNNVIVFDSKNVKQFWIDKSVFAKDDKINILLNANDPLKNNSIPLNVQLVNVNETMDCKIDIITEDSNAAFSILNKNTKEISCSTNEEDFINYHVSSAKFHMEDTSSDSFNIVFSSPNSDLLSINKIVMSFSTNLQSLFLLSPGSFTINKDNSFSENSSVQQVSNTSISLTGKNSKLFSKKKFICNNNKISYSVKVKNIGEEPANIYFGFRPFDKKGNILQSFHYPYKSGKTLKVVSYKEGSTTLIVDSYPEWKNGCTLAINTEEDFSDIPNTSVFYQSEKIIDVKKIENGQTEITIDRPLKQQLKPETRIRLHSFGGGLIYTHTKLLQPGEETLISGSIEKDDLSLEYSPKAFPRGVYSVQPLLFSFSNPSESSENTVLISDLSFSY